MTPPTPRDSRPARRAFFLAEAMVSLGLFGVFAIAATSLVLFSARTTIQADRRQEAAAGLDAAIEWLRRDVWEAVAVEADATTVTCRRADGTAILWRVEPDAMPQPALRLTRAAGDEPAAAALPQRWDGLPPDLTFAASGPTLRVSFRRSSNGSDADLVLMSQHVLAGGAK